MKLTFLLSLVLVALLPALAQAQADSPEQARRDYEVRLDRLESRAGKAMNALTRADLTITSLADRLEQTYMSASRVVYYEDFEQATATLRPAVAELGSLVADLEIMVADIKPDQALHKKATLIQARIEKLGMRLERELGLAASGRRVEEFATKIVNEVRIPPSSFPLTGGERAMAQEIGDLTERAEQSLRKAEKLSRDLVEKSALD
ncbi:MAG: hypothetical protein WC314_05820 [Vulcanimicrobiota bacterium]